MSPIYLAPYVELPPLAGDKGWWSGVAPVELCDVVTGAAPRRATLVRAAWNERELRVLFEVADDYMVATLTQRDAPLYTEEVVEVFIDPVGDLGAYFEIELNPLNAVLDLVVRVTQRGLTKEAAWDCEGLQTAAHRTEIGWNGELSIPFAGLAAKAPQVGQRMRVNFCRIDRPVGRERELTAWAPTGRELFHVPHRFGTLEFVGRG